MDPLSVTGTVIAVIQITSTIITICYDYRQGTKSASRQAVQISGELQSLKDVLDALLRLVEQASSSENADLSTFEQLIRKDGPLLTCQTELLALKAKVQPQEGWRKIKQSLEWPIKEGDMKKILLNLERLKSTMQLALSADQVALTMGIRSDVEDLTRLFQRHDMDQTRQEIYKWLAAPDPHANHVANRKKCQPNTGSWLLKSRVYEDWLQQPNSFLWIYGIPGSGKTVLCSTIVEHLIPYCLDMPRTAVAYFYFDFRGAGKRDLNSLLKSLIVQLSNQSDVVPPFLLEIYRDCQTANKPPQNEALVASLQNLLLIFECTYIVFDALDESSDCEELLEFISTMQNWDLSRLHLLVTSRQLVEIEETFSTLVTDHICLQNSKQNIDIYLYVVDKLKHDKALAKWPADLQYQIQRKLLTEENGMFQWVVCQLDMLKSCLSVTALRDRMNVLAKSLDETYTQILSGIDEIYQNEVMRILQALTVANDFLSLDEIVEFLAVDLESDPPRFNPEYRLLDPRSVLSMCSSLVIHSREISYANMNFGVGGTVLALRLAHASVADFLTQQKPSNRSSFHFSRYEARQNFARTCLVYLLNPAFSRGRDKTSLKDRVAEYPLLPHAISNWPIYLARERGDPEGIPNKTKELVQRFFATSKMEGGGNFAFWVETLISSSPVHYVQGTQPLYYAAFFGLTEVVPMILDTEENTDINALFRRIQQTSTPSAGDFMLLLYMLQSIEIISKW